MSDHLKHVLTIIWLLSIVPVATITIAIGRYHDRSRGVESESVPETFVAWVIGALWPFAIPLAVVIIVAYIPQMGGWIIDQFFAYRTRRRVYVERRRIEAEEKRAQQQERIRAAPFREPKRKLDMKK